MMQVHNKMMRVHHILLPLVAAGCVEPAPPPAPDLAPPRAAATAPTPPTPLPPQAEVEIAGHLARPPRAKGQGRVWVTNRPCWQPDTQAFGRGDVPLSDDFLTEVFVPQGTNLWLCGALVDGNKPIVYYGQGVPAPLYGKGAGEVGFTGVQIALRKGRPVAPPPSLLPPPAAR
jgi:hypothetical protein